MPVPQQGTMRRRCADCDTLGPVGTARHAHPDYEYQFCLTCTATRRAANAAWLAKYAGKRRPCTSGLTVLNELMSDTFGRR